MTELFTELTFWHWFILGGILLIIEVMVPSTLFLWPGLAALLVGIAVAITPMPWTIAVTVWAVLSVVTVTGWIFYKKKHPSKADESSGLNQRGHEFIGKTLTLEKPVINGKGEVHAGDTVWKVVSNQDISAGTPVQVTGVEGISLKVEPKNQ